MGDVEHPHPPPPGPQPSRAALASSVVRGSRSFQRLVALERFLKQSAACGVALRVPAGAGRGEACFIKGDAVDGEDDSRNYVPGLTRILEAVYFNQEPARGAAAPGAEGGRRRLRARARGREVQLYPDLEINPKDLAGAVIDGQQVSSCHASGKTHGSIVHSHVERMIKRYQEAGSFGSPFYTESEANGFRWDPCALRVMDFLAEREYWPVATEVVVHDPILNIATAIDLVVVDTRNSRDVVFVELKSSTSSKPFEAEGGGQPLPTMRGAPFEQVPDDKLHRARVQSICTAMLAMRTGYGLRPDRCVVLFVSPNAPQVVEYAMPEWYRDRVEELETKAYQSLLTHRQQERRDIMASALPLDGLSQSTKKKRRKPEPGQGKPRKRPKAGPGQPAVGVWE